MNDQLFLGRYLVAFADVIHGMNIMQSLFIITK